ncbi:MAG: family acetyltransferase [Belnapia sp.]|nr:family acetyltransferase [Belnapia sp.]
MAELERTTMQQSPMRVRQAGPADAPAVLRLVRDAYARWVPLIGREPLPMRVDYAQAAIAHDIALLERDGELLALIETFAAPGHLFIENVAVAPTHQGQGLGRRMMALAEAEARAAGLGELRLLTNAAFAANVRLYQGLGFRIDRTEPYLAGTTVFMSKVL